MRGRWTLLQRSALESIARKNRLESQVLSVICVFPRPSLNTTLTWGKTQMIFARAFLTLRFPTKTISSWFRSFLLSFNFPKFFFCVTLIFRHNRRKCAWCYVISGISYVLEYHYPFSAKNRRVSSGVRAGNFLKVSKKTRKMVSLTLTLQFTSFSTIRRGKARSRDGRERDYVTVFGHAFPFF